MKAQTMRCAYEAANTVEAHMIANLLEQQDIGARVDGEYLTSGIGELPAMGLVRVMVSDTDFERARQVITRWESESPPQVTREPARSGYGFGGFVLGVALTAGVAAWGYRSPPAEEGIDYDGDGRLDERYFYEGRYLRKTQMDRNSDGSVDLIYHYDARGRLLASQADNDFDGHFEATGRFARGNLVTLEVDTNLDGRVDRRSRFRYGVLNQVIVYSRDGRTIIRREHYDSDQLRRAEIDTDEDGVLDTTYEYDPSGELRVQ